MNRKLSMALIVALALMLTLSAVVFAQESADDQAIPAGQGIAPQDGTGYQRGGSLRDPGMVRRGMGVHNGSGASYADADGDGQCDRFVDEDGDGLCDNCDHVGRSQIGRRGVGNGDDAGRNGTMERGSGRHGGYQGRHRS